MKRVSIPTLLSQFEDLDKLGSLPEGDINVEKIRWQIRWALIALGGLTNSSSFSSNLRTSRALGERLRVALVGIDELKDGEEVPSFRTMLIAHYWKEYRTVLAAELDSMNIYIITNKGGFDTNALIEQGQLLFPPDLESKVPEALEDIRQGCRCLANETATAAAFHFFRALECVIIRYVRVFSNAEIEKKSRSLGVYIRYLEQSKKCEERVIAVLRQLKDLHRNPLMHPESHLDTEAAISIVGIVRSAMVEMLSALHAPLESHTSQEGFGQIATLIEQSMPLAGPDKGT